MKRIIFLALMAISMLGIISCDLLNPDDDLNIETEEQEQGLTFPGNTTLPSDLATAYTEVGTITLDWIGLNTKLTSWTDWDTLLIPLHSSGKSDTSGTVYNETEIYVTITLTGDADTFCMRFYGSLNGVYYNANDTTIEMKLTRATGGGAYTILDEYSAEDVKQYFENYGEETLGCSGLNGVGYNNAARTLYEKKLGGDYKID